MMLGQNGMRHNTKHRTAKNTYEHDQADFYGNHNLSLVCNGLIRKSCTAYFRQVGKVISEAATRFSSVLYRRGKGLRGDKRFSRTSLRLIAVVNTIATVLGST